jgi:hypothetical protein
MDSRRMATRPHYRHSHEAEWISIAAISFIVGAMLGATIALWFVSL